MRLFWFILYNLIFYPLFFILTVLLIPFNRKIRDGFIGRLKTRRKLADFKNNTSFSENYWFHVSSHGEYQQVQSIIAELKKDNSIGIIVSFFSPSGFNNVHDNNIDCKIYLPFDFLISLYRSLKIVKPSKFIIASYDVWPNVISICKILGIKTLLISLRIHPNSFKLSLLGRSLYKSTYQSINQIFTVSTKDLSNLRKIINNKEFMAMGNPRFDMANNKSQGVDIKFSYDERIQKKLFLFASLWPEDHSILFPKIFDLLKNDESSKIVLVPHELSDGITNYYVDQIEKNNLSYKIIDAYMDLRNIEQNIIIVNTVGILYKLYWQAYIAYIGGGFSNNGIHNIMEPAVAGNPVIFGPNHSNSNFLEASQLLNKSAAFEVSSSEELMHRFNRLLDRDFYLSASDASKSVIDNNLGSTKKLISKILDE
tara:strand:- start:422 stop:1696 length:1275 start_codon:yes stop_codon:yes gene_type:complete